MGTVAFDTHAFIKRLRDAGFSEEQAEAQISVLKEAQEARLEELATKQDLKHDLAQTKVEIIQWVVATAGVVIAAIKLIP